MTWSEEQKERVRQLWADGLSATLIAIEVGAVSRNAIIGVISRGGWQRSAGAKLQQVQRQQTRQRLAKVAPRVGKIVPLIPRKDFEPPKNLTPPDANPVTFLELTNSTCRWPLGEFNERVEFYCGAAADNVQSPYCIFHQHIALVGSAAIFPSDSAPQPPDYAAVRRKSSLNSCTATRKVA